MVTPLSKSKPTFTFKYGVLDYSIPENSLLASYSTEDQWFIYGPIRHSITATYWIDNWNNIWDRICIPEYPSLGLTMRQSGRGFTTPLSDQCIENIVSQQWILESTNPFSIQRCITYYVDMAQEIEILKDQISHLTHTHTLELEAAGKLLDDVYIDLEKEQQKRASEHVAISINVEKDKTSHTPELDLLGFEQDVIIFET